MGNLNFNAADVAPSTGFDTLPAGTFTALIGEATMKPTKSGTGSYIECVFQVVEGEYKGRKVWERITFTNPSAKSTEIGRAQLSALCRAIGVMSIQDTAELCNRPCLITVGHEKGNDDKMYARVTKYAPTGGGFPVPAVAAAPGAPAAPPWKRAG